MDKEFLYKRIKKNYKLYKRIMLILVGFVVFFICNMLILKIEINRLNFVAWFILVIYFYSFSLKNKVVKDINNLIDNNDFKYGSNNKVFKRHASALYDFNTPMAKYVLTMQK